MKSIAYALLKAGIVTEEQVEKAESTKDEEKKPPEDAEPNTPKAEGKN